MTRLFDSHTHLDNTSYKGEAFDRLIHSIEDSDVAYVVDIGSDLNTSANAVKHSESYPWCYAAVGVHPHDVKDMDDDMLILIKGLAKKPKVVAIGEIGLDYYRNLSPKDEQIHWFREQIRLALELDKPIVIHDRDAHGDVMNILKEEGVFSEERKSKFSENAITGTKDARLLIHCYSGSAEMAMQYIKLGATISIAGPVTYNNNHKTVDVVKEVPLDHLLIETDAPYLTPEPFRGKQNSSPLVEYTAKKIAEIKGIDYEEVAETTLVNAKRFFSID
jgi:TatD DNase family protein